MSKESDFIITLPSNASGNIFPDNKPHNYTTLLAKPLELEGKWEVSMLDVQIPHNWFNIKTKTLLQFAIGRTDTNGIYKKSSSETTNTGRYLNDQIDINIASMGGGKKSYHSYDVLECEINPGYYPDVQAILNTIMAKLHSKYKNEILENNALEEEENEDEEYIGPQRPKKILDFKYFKSNDIVQLKSKGLPIMFEQISSGNELLKILGIVNTQNFVSICAKGDLKGRSYFSQFLPFRSTKPTSLLMNPSLYIYSDVVTHQHVGDAMVPLLGIVPIKGTRGELCSFQWSHPQYVPVRSGYINSIEIQLNLDSGEMLNIRSGKVVIRLHFRKCGGLM